MNFRDISNHGIVSKLEFHFDRYRLFVTKNPLLANEIELGLKWISYIAAGRFSGSPVITELIHSISNLLTLVNDNILRKAANTPIHDNVIVKRIQNYLAILEYSEVFAEIAADRIIGKKGKWLIIVLLQLVKTALRLLLILKHKQGIQHSPPIPPLNRKRDVPNLCEKDTNTDACDTKGNVDITFQLKRSGRTIRTLDAAPPLVSRSWQLPKILENDLKLCYREPTSLSDKCLAGEIIHVCRPIAHLLCLGAFSESSWKPWLVALGMDITSLHLLQKGNFNRAEKLEISRRALSFILYLLRSPFYDKYARIHINNTLKNFSDKIPGSGLLLRPVIDYIPEWQKFYFYTWTL